MRSFRYRAIPFCYCRCDAALFSGATGVPLNSMGIFQDNPSSADAIETMRKDITDEAECFTENNTDSMFGVACFVMEILDSSCIMI